MLPKASPGLFQGLQDEEKQNKKKDYKTKLGKIRTAVKERRSRPTSLSMAVREGLLPPPPDPPKRPPVDYGRNPTGTNAGVPDCQAVLPNGAKCGALKEAVPCGRVKKGKKVGQICLECRRRLQKSPGKICGAH